MAVNFGDTLESTKAVSLQRFDYWEALDSNIEYEDDLISDSKRVIAVFDRIDRWCTLVQIDWTRNGWNGAYVPFPPEIEEEDIGKVAAYGAGLKEITELCKLTNFENPRSSFTVFVILASMVSRCHWKQLQQIRSAMPLAAVEHFVIEGHSQTRKPAIKLLLRLWGSSGDLALSKLVSYVGRGDREDAMEALAALARAGFSEKEKMSEVANMLTEMGDARSKALQRVQEVMAEETPGDIKDGASLVLCSLALEYASKDCIAMSPKIFESLVNHIFETPSRKVAYVIIYVIASFTESKNGIRLFFACGGVDLARRLLLSRNILFSYAAKAFDSMPETVFETIAKLIFCISADTVTRQKLRDFGIFSILANIVQESEFIKSKRAKLILQSYVQPLIDS